ncbi:RNA-binding protein 48-like [Oscarella lobularis]|uniref:RNA-binding protein 48-like n=1 Tax=Oscarella lobularis TaxID=121494 RepID=UPI0033135F78
MHNMNLHAEVKNHHRKDSSTVSRPLYRDSRRERAVKVYTINQESRYLLVQGVPEVGAAEELVQLFALYGTIEEYMPLHEYPCEKFTEVYLIKFQQLSAAKTAKRKLDDTSFMGGILHVCYAPEFESIQDTRAKLDERLAVCEHGGKRFKRDPEVAACSSKEAVSNPAPQSNVSKSEAKSEDASASSTGKSTPRKKRADDKRKRI